MILISVFDAKAGSFAPPIAYDHIAQCIRSYVAFARQKPDAMQIQFCEDYNLYDVGTFDPMTGLVAPIVPPNFVESMTHIVAQARKEVSNGQAQ